MCSIQITHWAQTQSAKVIAFSVSNGYSDVDNSEPEPDVHNDSLENSSDDDSSDGNDLGPEPYVHDDSLENKLKNYDQKSTKIKSCHICDHEIKGEYKENGDIACWLKCPCIVYYSCR